VGQKRGPGVVKSGPAVWRVCAVGTPVWVCELWERLCRGVCAWDPLTGVCGWDPCVGCARAWNAFVCGVCAWDPLMGVRTQRAHSIRPLCSSCGEVERFDGYTTVAAFPADETELLCGLPVPQVC
jgi:hypothetical protein